MVAHVPGLRFGFAPVLQHPIDGPMAGLLLNQLDRHLTKESLRYQASLQGMVAVSGRIQSSGFTKRCFTRSKPAMNAFLVRCDTSSRGGQRLASILLPHA